MNSSRKPLSLLIAMLTPLWSLSAGAVGLGELTARSNLGEPLRAEIRLLRQGEGELDPNCVRRASPADSDDMPWIRTARIRVAGDKLIITTREPINHPIAMLGIQLGCESPLRRDYPILLQPPVGHRAPVSLPEVSTVHATSPAAGAGAGTSSAAPRRNIERSPLPSSAAPKQARSSRQDNPPARSLAPVPSSSDRLIIGSGADAGLAPLRMSLLLSSPPAGEQPDGTRQQLNQEQRTLAEIDDRIASQLEVNEKIRRLEEYQLMLKERIVQLDQAKPGPAPAAAAQQTAAASALSSETLLETLKDWAPTLAGLTAALAGLGTMIWLRRRKRRAEEADMTTEPAFETDMRISAPPQTVGRSRRDEPADMRAMPPVQHSIAPLPPADTSAEWADPTFAPAHPIPFDETVDEQDSALELAEIMMSFGRTQGAAETLADYIRNNPRQAVKPWLKLLDVYHVAGMRSEFEALTRQLNKTFNVKMVSWNDFKAVRSAPADSIEQMPHITQRLQDLWGTQEAQAYIHQILRDNRNGTRQGFPLSVVEELLLLLAILDGEFGPYKPPSEPSLEPMAPAEPLTQPPLDF
ncbi:hypothetical protein [uncultured Zoogloea sp.]|uniref:type IV pilus assembly protein FimV n=2 Tax=Zoogloea TaxID=349 RepID=UPI00260F23AC|nr:hypothetical protein [uncultured Zoogloea sp.]